MGIKREGGARKQNADTIQGRYSTIHKSKIRIGCTWQQSLFKRENGRKYLQRSEFPPFRNEMLISLVTRTNRIWSWKCGSNFKTILQNLRREEYINLNLALDWINRKHIPYQRIRSTNVTGQHDGTCGGRSEIKELEISLS